MKINKVLAFDDVLLKPKFSMVKSRRSNELSTSFSLSPYATFNIPIISAPMNSVTEWELALALGKLGGLGIVHRYMDIEVQTRQADILISNGIRPAFAIGATGDYIDRALSLFDCGVDIFCIDIANGDSIVALEAMENLTKKFQYDKVTYITGNVATPDGVKRLIDVGSHAVRLSVGSGAACSTRIVTGFGIPTLQAIMDASMYRDKCCLIADGGIKNSGDIVKSIAAGAHCVMLGSMLAGAKESPAREEKPGFKRYSGMASKEAHLFWGDIPVSPEGESALIPIKGSLQSIIDSIMGGLKSGMSYGNAFSLNELYENAEFVEISQNGFRESKPHIKE